MDVIGCSTSCERGISPPSWNTAHAESFRQRSFLIKINKRTRVPETELTANIFRQRRMDHVYCKRTVASTTRGTQCFAINCKNYQTAYYRSLGITFHKFPNKVKQPVRHGEWVRNCRRTVPPSDRSLICSQHFPECSLDRTGQIVRLREDAVPTIFELPEHLQTKVKLSRNSETSKRACQPLLTPDTAKRSRTDSKSHSLDHKYSFSEIESMRVKLQVFRARIRTLERKLKSATAREKRAKSNYKKLLVKLKEQNLLNDELEQKLKQYKDVPSDLFNKTTKCYTEDQKKFALTLHLYSPKGFDFVRRHLPLPSPRTLRRWLEGVDSEPGLNISMIMALAKKRFEQPDIYTHCSLSLDAMNIRRQLQYDHHKKTTIGYVDLGAGPEVDGQEASEALVFMLTGLKGAWKAPVAFFLTRGLTAETQKQLLLHCLMTLRSNGLLVHCVTMDGHASNLGMCRSLGAQLDVDKQVKPYFTLEGNLQKIFILLDPCHMVKLVRNMLQAYGSIKSPTGVITWDLLKDLHKDQQNLGLRLGNKLTSRHIDFHKNKMKVSLATQTLSSSVATALLALKQMGVSRYMHCDATVEFIRTCVHHRPHFQH